MEKVKDDEIRELVDKYKKLPYISRLMLLTSANTLFALQQMEAGEQRTPLAISEETGK